MMIKVGLRSPRVYCRNRPCPIITGLTESQLVYPGARSGARETTVTVSLTPKTRLREAIITGPTAGIPSHGGERGGGATRVGDRGEGPADASVLAAARSLKIRGGRIIMKS